MKILYNISGEPLIKKSLILISRCCFVSLSCVWCRSRHVSDALVSLHAFFPLLATKLLHRDTAHSSWIQTVWSDTWGEINSNKGQFTGLHINNKVHCLQHISMTTWLFLCRNAKYQVSSLVCYFSEVTARSFNSHCEHNISPIFKYHKSNALKSRQDSLMMR